jgi:hypothetical protein
MSHYKIAILHAKSFLLQSLVTLLNTVYIHSLTESSFVIKIPYTKCPNVSFLLLKYFVKFSIYKVSKFMVFTNFEQILYTCLLNQSWLLAIFHYVCTYVASGSIQ